MYILQAYTECMEMAEQLHYEALMAGDATEGGGGKGGHSASISAGDGGVGALGALGTGGGITSDSFVRVMEAQGMLGMRFGQSAERLQNAAKARLRPHSNT